MECASFCCGSRCPWLHCALFNSMFASTWVQESIVASDAGDEALRRSFWIWFLREKEVWGRVGFSERPVRPNPEVVLPSL